MDRSCVHKRSSARGAAAVEFALVLMLLLTLALPVIDYARAIQANTILINITREGASQASRGAQLDRQKSQAIMNALAATTPPLTMATRGMIYITEVEGKKEGGVITNVVKAQYKWANGSYADKDSALWACSSWEGDGKCNVTGEPVVGLMANQLAAGEAIYVVESYYHFDALLSGLDLGVALLPEVLYSRTVF